MTPTKAKGSGSTVAGVNLATIRWLLFFIMLIELLLTTALLNYWRKDLVAILTGWAIAWGFGLGLPHLWLGLAVKLPGAG